MLKPAVFIIEDSQALAELLAAISLGNDRLGSTSVRELAAVLTTHLGGDQEHYLYLRDADDLASFFGCGIASGGTDLPPV